MPAFIKTDADERIWARAKAYAHESYPDLTEDDDNFWKITTSIYKKLNGSKMNKKASTILSRVLSKTAYVPLTPAAEMAMQPEAEEQGGMPVPPPQDGGGMPPMDPAAMPQAAAPIQTVPGPNGEPIDQETGFIVVDPQNGIELEPMSGLLFIKPIGEFMTQDGQPIPPEQAEQIIMQANQMGAPQDSAPGAAPMDPAMMGAEQMPVPEAPTTAPVSDPAAAEAMMAGQPMIDPQTGLPIDPNTGMFATMGAAPAGMGGALPEGDLEQLIPGLQTFVEKYDKTVDRQDKLNKRMLSELSGTRTDLQGLRREIQQNNDNQDTLLVRLENLLNVIESLFGAHKRD